MDDEDPTQFQNNDIRDKHQKSFHNLNNNYQVISEKTLNTLVSPKSNEGIKTLNTKNDLIYSNEEFNNFNTDEILQKNEMDESFAKKYLNSLSPEKCQPNLLSSNDGYEEKENNIEALNSPKSEINASKASSLKQDIDNLDSEIRHLQGKLKYMIENKKKE